ncbi:MAG: hypothetical protein ACT6Q9_03100 [Polaromonas sp.]|uniref:hypothetical protein n=1 Tax=Polaromonas sp. TaxID=1869339 RepID=UPI00403568AF
MTKSLSVLVAAGGGFGLSFLGLGTLWAGAAWHYQALMFFPFFVLAFALTRLGPSGDKLFLLVICGASPLGLLLTMFRDRNDSHLMPILMVCTWLFGVLSGHWLAGKLPRRGDDSA